jgi:hypothetical protein
MNRDLFLAILAMDSYNRGYGKGVVVAGASDGVDNGEIDRKIGNATIILQDTSEAALAASFFAIAYDVSGAGIDGLTGTVIAYRGSDYEDTNGDILRSNDLWQGWELRCHVRYTLIIDCAANLCAARRLWPQTPTGPLSHSGLDKATMFL